MATYVPRQKPVVWKLHERFDVWGTTSSPLKRWVLRRNWKGFYLFVLVAFASLFAFAAEEFTLKSELSGMDFDWSNGLSYVGNVAPSVLGAYVCIPDGMDAMLSPTNSASWNFVTNKIARIRPMTGTSRLVVHVPTEASPASFPCEVTYSAQNKTDNYDKGGLVKRGDGELKLTATGYYSYFTVLTAENGTLTLLENGETSKNYVFDTLVVLSNAVMNTVGGSKTLTKPRRFSGTGTINCRGYGIQTISSDTCESKFSGGFTGSGGRMFTACSPTYLTGTNSTALGDFWVMNDIVVSVMSFGRYNTDVTTSSSIGTGGLAILGSGQPGGVVYLGDGEVTDVMIDCRDTLFDSFSFIDAGAHGGLVLSNSTVKMEGPTASFLHRAFVLQGSNATESIFANKFTERYDTKSPANYCPFHLVKRGSGTWRMAHVADTMLSGGISVENGTLKYDTIADAGTICALGYATNLFEAYTCPLSESRPVSWAIALGSTNGTEGAIEYSGGKGVACSTRPIALKGDGRIEQNVDTPFRFCGISSVGECAKTLVLGGSGKGGNEISGINDMDGGAVSVVKDGEGTWTLTATNSFRGALSVNSGTLNVCAPNWNWFRFVDRQSYTNDTGTQYFDAPSGRFFLTQMAFFNEDGISQTIGLAFTNSLQEITFGTFAYTGRFTVVEQSGTLRPWSNLFDDTTSYCNIKLTGTTPRIENSDTWASIFIRLPENADPVSSFDLVWAQDETASTAYQHPSYFSIEGSLDGFSWTELFSTNHAGTTAVKTKWMTNESGAKYAAGDLVKAKTISDKRREGICLAAPLGATSPLDAVSCVGVASNATLKSLYGTTTLKVFGLDMTHGGGMVDGFTFATDGLFSVTNVAVLGNIAAAFTPVNCIGVENLSRWTLRVNGHETTKYTVIANKNGTIQLVQIGSRMIVR